MTVSLLPVSHPAMQAIVVDDNLVSVGRSEEPFASFQDRDVARLSRRHARLFRQDNSTYVVDQGSRNGTRVNDWQVGKTPVQLKDGDEVRFGGAFVFRVAVAEASEGYRDAATPNTVLVLSPVDVRQRVRSIVISRFPFLVTRVNSVFECNQKACASDLQRISRRHAVFSLKNDDVVLEDLDSANGTFVSGEQLDDDARVLQEGDEIVFGSDRFRYKVALKKPQPSAVADVALSEAVPRALLVDQTETIFVSSPSSFLEIFCDQRDSDEDPRTAPLPSVDFGRPANSARSASEVPSNTASATVANHRNGWLGVAAATLVVIAIAGVYLPGGERRELGELLALEKYQALLAPANDYLMEHPDDDEVADWAQQALIKSVAGEWQETVDQLQFAKARTRLESIRATTEAIPHSADVIDLLGWTTDLEAHMHERGGPGAPMVLFQHEDAIASLVNAWDSRAATFRQLMTQIVAMVPAFDAVHTRTMSHLRTLQNDKSLYGVAIAELKHTVEQHLNRDEHEKISSAISEFADQFPTVAGVAALRADVTNFETLKRYLSEGDLKRIVSFSRRREFHTKLFRHREGVWLRESLPPVSVITQFESATEAWRQGDAVRSEEVLLSLIDGPWGSFAAQRIARQRRIVNELRTLQSSSEQADRRQRLTELWGSLRSPEDAYYLNALAPEYNTHRAGTIKQLNALYRRTGAIWKSYRNAGGIPAVMRVEEDISTRYKAQARRLSQAFTAIDEGARTHQQMRIDPAGEWQLLHTEIRNETKRQRRSLRDLGLVLEPDLLQAKLAMLPTIEE